jgi:predicted nucleic acid-binding protein
MRAFIDTNVLVYLFDADNPTRRDRAKALLARQQDDLDLVLSTQVLQEFYVAATRKLARPLSLETAERAVRDLAALCAITVDADLVLQAIGLARTHGFSFWDALIVQAAQRAGAEVLFTEDMQAGRVIDNLLIQNPFSDAP